MLRCSLRRSARCLVAVEPNLYKSAVAIAPVTDLALLKTEAEHYTNYELVKDFVGSGPHVGEGSPLRHAAAMAAALRGAGDKVEFVRFKSLDHQLDDSDARVQVLTRIGEFLDSAIGH